MNLVKMIAHHASGFMVGLLLFIVGLKELLDKTGSPTGGTMFVIAGILYCILNYTKYNKIKE